MHLHDDIVPAPAEPPPPTTTLLTRRRRRPNTPPAAAGDDPAAAAAPAPSAALEEQDVSVYCAGYLPHALVVLALEGVVLRLATLLALWACPRGASLEPLVGAAGAGWARARAALRRRRPAAAAPAAAPAAGKAGV